MVKREERRRVNYFCEICHSVFDKRSKAEECELQAPQKKDLMRYGHTQINNWKIGDMILVHIHDDWRRYRLGIIEDTHIHEHTILPKISFLDREPEVWDSWDYEDVHFLGDKMKERILEWAKLIVNLKNPSARVDQDD